MTIDELVRRCDSLHRDLAEEYHRAGTGVQAGLDTTGIFDRYDDLVGLDLVAQVTAAARSAEGDERRRLELLRAHVAWIYDAHAGRTVTDAIQHQESLAEVEVDGRRMPYRALQVAIVNEADRARRGRLAAARDEALDRFEPLYLDQVRLWHRVAGDLGYRDHYRRCLDPTWLPLDRLRRVMARLLAETEEVYHRVLHRHLAGQGIPADQGTWADLVHLFRVVDHDAWFPAESLVAQMTGLMESMGLDIRAGGNVDFDLDDRPLKSPRPFCSVIEIPRRVVLVLRPVGGLSDYAAFLHELGHAMHFGHTAPDLAWEYRYLGDNSITEGFAFLFDRLTVHPAWLRDVAGVPDPEPLVELLALRELMMLRKYAAQLIYEQDLFEAVGTAEDLSPWREEYARRLGAATGVRQPPANYLNGIDPLFYSARYLQGWLFEAALSEHLTHLFGDHWFRDRGAGELLLSLYRRGQDRPVAEVFESIGAESLGLGPVMARVERELGDWPTAG